MSESVETPELTDCCPAADELLAEVLDGLRRSQKELPCKLFYDQRGSQLFDRICELDEYYPTRTELAIMQNHAGEMAEAIGERCLLIEYGSGSSLKTRLLLDHVPELAGYVPIDISRDHLFESAKRIAGEYPGLTVQPVCADYTGSFDLPDCPNTAAYRAVYFPGSTIGNFRKPDALTFLQRIARVVQANGSLLVGVDLKKDTGVLEAAYNDETGVTAEFNLNALHRMNNEMDGTFDVDAFQHKAFYNHALGRIEMHIESLAGQTAEIAGETFTFEAGETIHTECSHKYSLEEFAALANHAGFNVDRVWTDPNQWFSVQRLKAA